MIVSVDFEPYGSFVDTVRLEGTAVKTPDVTPLPHSRMYHRAV